MTATDLENAAARGEAIVDGDIVYAPLRSLESVGVLLDRRTGGVEQLRSALSLEHYVWAKQRGFQLHAPNRLAITNVRQHDEVVAVLRCAFDPRHVRSELARAGKAPLVLDLDWPQSALLIERLCMAKETNDAFDFEVNPA